MKMQHQLQISIPKPCHENWNTMSASAQGRHCKMCNKVVVDFTTMNDEHLLQYIHNAQGDVCGHIKLEQLSKSKDIEIPRKLKIFLYSIAMVFLMNVSIESFAQINTDSIQVIQFEICEIYGRVTNKSNEPLANIKVTVLDRRHQTIADIHTDTNGEYRIIDIPLSIYSIRFESVSYFSEEVIGVRMGNKEQVKYNVIMKKQKSRKRNNAEFVNSKCNTVLGMIIVKEKMSQWEIDNAVEDFIHRMQ